MDDSEDEAVNQFDLDDSSSDGDPVESNFDDHKDEESVVVTNEQREEDDDVDTGDAGRHALDTFANDDDQFDSENFIVRPQRWLRMVSHFTS